jgi:hypothetical protein
VESAGGQGFSSSLKDKQAEGGVLGGDVEAEGALRCKVVGTEQREDGRGCAVGRAAPTEAPAQEIPRASPPDRP